MNDQLKKRMAEVRELMRKCEYHLPGFRPDTPYADSYEAFIRQVRAAGGNAEELVKYGEKMIEPYYTARQTVDAPKPFVPARDESEYPATTEVNMSRTPEGVEYVPFPTRSVHTLKDYKVQAEFPKMDKWGGSLEAQYEATGYFYVRHDGTRFTMVDPEGHPYYNVGMNKISIDGASENAKRNALEKFGSYDNWTDETLRRLQELGFTCGSRSSDTDRIVRSAQPYAVCGTANFISQYGRDRGLVQHGVGHVLFLNNNAMPVFDPDFETFADDYAGRVAAPYRDEQKIVGWFSDNELPVQYNMLERFLTLDASKPYNHYSLAAAWAFLRRQTGKENPTLEDAVEAYFDIFRGVVYERYFRVVRGALKRAVPNHMYIGCRFSYVGKIYQEGKTLSEEILRAAGRWCDVVTINYYMAWELDPELVLQWEQWTGKPFMSTEWYAMAYDSGLACQTGAGFRVRAQKDRAAFYQNYALWLLECPWFVGFHWFMYMDNDPNSDQPEPSNVNSNKGIVTVKFEEWTELTSAMQELNQNVYPLIQYFDKRNGLKK